MNFFFDWLLIGIDYRLFFQPIGVLMERGCGTDLLINILLTLLGYIPGLIHACYIVCKY